MRARTGGLLLLLTLWPLLFLFLQVGLGGPGRCGRRGAGRRGRLDQHLFVVLLLLLQEVALQEVLHAGTLGGVRGQTAADEVACPQVADAEEDLGRDLADHLLVDLSGVGALAVGRLLGHHLEDAHPEGVHVHLLVVLLIVELGRHELGGAEHRERCSPSRDIGGEPQVPDAEIARGSVDKDVVALEVPMDDGRDVGVQIEEPAQDLPAPALDDFPADNLHLLDEVLEGAGGKNLRNENHLLPLPVHPGAEEGDDVPVIELLEQAHLVHDPDLLLLGQPRQTDGVPGHQ
jgi:hypothetical protein